MALAGPLFTSQLYRENANVDTYMQPASALSLPIPCNSLAIPCFFPFAPGFLGSLHPLTNIPLINLLTVRYRLIERAGLRSPVSSLPIDSTRSFDFVH